MHQIMRDRRGNNNHLRARTKPSTTQVAVDHLNMLISLVEEMTTKWERQLEDDGEGAWDDDLLAREGTPGEHTAWSFAVVVEA